MNTSSARRKPTGFILPMVLILLSLMAVAVAGISRKGMNALVHANLAVEELQHRWGGLSCRAALMPRLEQVIQSEEKSFLRPMAYIQLQTALGQYSLSLLLFDEQAKININTLTRRKDRVALQADLAQLLKQIRDDEVRIPLPADGKSGVRQEVLTTYDQFLIGTMWRQRIGAVGVQEYGPVALMSCWTNGKVHYARADEAALRLLLSRSLGVHTVDRLVELRKSWPEVSLPDALNQLQITQEQRAFASRALTDESRCHSLWFVMRGRTRTYQQLSVWSDMHESPRRYRSGMAAKPQDVKTVYFEW